ncbi:MAG: (5-formylfuran-3-yl)methyl phosphate synthase [Candidatus Bathyarchaeota archaeon]|nr:(5-formylfuran-3-yl)methyl phosphate synthase [Candidatus Bathyarchaeota archaeon]
MKLLISVVDVEEALKAFKGKADIVDVKNPLEGSLGAPKPGVVAAVRKVLPKNVEVSTAIGDVPNLPGTVSLAVFGAACLNVDYVKVGVYGSRSLEEAYILGKSVVDAGKMLNKKVKVVLSSYADYSRVGCLSPKDVLQVAYKVEANIFMVDTKIKDGKSSFTFLSEDEVRKLCLEAHDKGLRFALAGSLSLNDVEKAFRCGVDILGFRGAVCSGDRVNGRIDEEKVLAVAEKLKFSLKF